MEAYFDLLAITDYSLNSITQRNNANGDYVLCPLTMTRRVESAVKSNKAIY